MDKSALTLKTYFSSYFRGLLSGLRGKNLAITLLRAVLCAAAATALTVFLFPNLFSLTPTANAAYSGVLVALLLLLVMGIIGQRKAERGSYGTGLLTRCSRFFKVGWVGWLYIALGAGVGFLLGHLFMFLLGVLLFLLSGLEGNCQFVLLGAAISNTVKPREDQDLLARHADYLAHFAVGLAVVAMVLLIAGM